MLKKIYRNCLPRDALAIRIRVPRVIYHVCVVRTVKANIYCLKSIYVCHNVTLLISTYVIIICIIVVLFRVCTLYYSYNLLEHERHEINC